MTGYVKTFTPELKIIEDKYYKAAYCGLCHSMKALTGQISRLLLSYDFTFLVLVRLAVTGEKPEFEQKRCFVHPLRKKLVMKKNKALDFASYASTLLAYRKFCDDIADEEGGKRFSAWLKRLFFTKIYRRVSSQFEELDKSVSGKLSELTELEKAKTASVDHPANVFGELMSDIFSYGTYGDTSRVLSEVGYSVGRWIYIIDALDDFDEDLRLGRYNPFIMLFDGNTLDTEKKKDIEAALLRVLDRARNALDLVDFGGRRDLCGLINNIMNEGMPRMAQAVINGMKNEIKAVVPDAESPELKEVAPENINNEIQSGDNDK